MELAVYNIEGKDTGKKVTLNDEVFGLEEPNNHAIYLDVKQYLANQRQGTHKSKERSEVAGSTKKLGRRGDINSPLLVGGGRVFGPRPRNYSFKLNKKVKALARKSALTYKAQKNEIVVVEDFNFEAPKTKNFVNFTKNLEIAGQKVLVVLETQKKNVYLSARNVEGANIVTASELNTYKILDNKKMVVTESSVAVLNQF